jgi:hypothetical protein
MKNLFLCLFLIIAPVLSRATHNIAGEIEFVQINDSTIEARIITYTDLNSIPADRDSLELGWGDGNFQWLHRVNGPAGPNGIPQGEVISPGFKKNIHTGTHIYAEAGTYLLSMTDPNRNAGIVNVNPPNSENIPFHIQTSLQLQGMGSQNSSPTLLEPPIDKAFVGVTYYHTPNAFDLDGDSLAYELITPMQGINEDVPNYTNIADIPTPGSSMLSLDEETGLLVWESPSLVGRYVVTYAITSYRNGVEIDRVIRDMQIDVAPGLNSPPDMILDASTTGIIPVSLGDTVVVNIQAEDPLVAAEDIDILSSCGLYHYFTDTATFTKNLSGSAGTAVFEWIVRDEHLRKQAYQLVVKVKDDFQGDGASKIVVVRFKTDFSTSISRKNKAERISINLFPNPTGNRLQIESNSFDYSSLLLYRIFDLKGRVVKNGQIMRIQRAWTWGILFPGSIFLNYRIVG